MGIELLFGFGTVALLAVLSYGAISYLRRDRRKDSVGNAATRALYNDPDHYDEQRKELKEELRRR
jgi:hypothetical protein